jgi:hypothetical protein
MDVDKILNEYYIMMMATMRCNAMIFLCGAQKQLAGALAGMAGQRKDTPNVFLSQPVRQSIPNLVRPFGFFLTFSCHTNRDQRASHDHYATNMPTYQ